MSSQKEIFRDLFKDGVDPGKAYALDMRGYEVIVSGIQEIHKLVLCEELDALKNYLQQFPDKVNLKTESGHSSLYLCVLYIQSIEIAQVLIDAGADVNDTNVNNGTLMHIVAINNDKEMVELLIKNGLSINTKNDFGDTPLHVAAVYKCYDAVRVLFDRADLTIKNIESESALYLLSMNCHDLFVELINEKNSEINRLQKLVQTYEDYGPPLSPDGGKGFQKSKEHFKSF